MLKGLDHIHNGGVGERRLPWQYEENHRDATFFKVVKKVPLLRFFQDEHRRVRVAVLRGWPAVNATTYL